MYLAIRRHHQRPKPTPSCLQLLLHGSRIYTKLYLIGIMKIIKTYLEQCKMEP